MQTSPESDNKVEKRAMITPQIVSRKEWDTAREKLLINEKP